MKRKYPKIGDIFYWKDLDGNIHDDICLKIEQENNDDLETMYFTNIHKNGGGVFVTEHTIVKPNSYEVKEYIKIKKKNKIKNFIANFNDITIRGAVWSVFNKYIDGDSATDLLNDLSDINKYEL